MVWLAIFFWAASPASAATWSRQASPNPFPQQDVLVDVDCVSAAWCMAVGSGVNSANSIRGFAARWNGSSWQTVSPSTDAGLHDVGCVSSSKCFAVGQRVALSTGHRLPVLLRWNGTGWTSVALSVPAAQQYATLDGVDCGTSTSCLAVGGTSNGSGTPFHTLAYHYNGTSWARLTSPNPSAGPAGNYFTDASCTSGSNCYAAGTAENKTLVERWRGASTWNRLPTPSPRAWNTFRAISCTSTTSCYAVGETYTADRNVENAFAEHYNGTSWSTRTFTASNTSSLSGVSCVSASTCIAVGGAGQRTLAVKHTAAGWATLSTPNPGVANYFQGVSCWAGPSCEAVGSYTTAASPGGRSLAARYS
jgi:hypothetical protein